MSYAVGNRQFPIRDFQRAIFDENPGGNGSNSKFPPGFLSEIARRKLFEPDCTVCCCLISHNIVSMYVCMVITYSKSMDQPGKVANPARGQMNRENEYFPVRVRA